MEAARARAWSIEQRRAEVEKLLCKGWSERRIAAHLGVGKTTVHTDAEAVLDMLRQTQVKGAELVRARELEKLATAETVVLEVLEAGEVEPDTALKAIDRLVKVQERRAKLLGLDAPERIDATVAEGPSPEMAARLVRERFAVEGAQHDERGDSAATQAAEHQGSGPIG